MYQSSVITMLIFAHRGASGTEPENTLRAITAAIAANADGIEIDLHQVAGKIVIIHDRWLQRTTSGQGQVSDYSVSHLRGLDAGKGELIPTLDEVLALVAGKCIINLELKAVTDLALLLRYIDDAIASTALTINDIILSSFDHRLLHQLHQQHPEFKLGALTASYPLTYAQFAEQLNATSINCDINFIDQALVDDAHQRGLKVMVYTVNEEVDILAMAALKVDGIFTNYPANAKALLASIG